jgi:alkanesulfonate monooxygenase
MTSNPRFGIWANVHGTMAALTHPDDPVDASWRRVRDQVLLAERLGFDCTLIAQHTMNPFGEELDQLDAWTAAAAVSAITDTIEVIAAIKPSVIHPTILAKQALGIEEISGGRFSINVVNAWWKPDLERSGIGMLEHDERYLFGGEWLHAVSALMTGQRTTLQGKYVNLDDFVIRPAGTYRVRPRIYLGGESEPARNLAVAEADVLFLNGQPVETAKEIIDDVRRRPRPTDTPIAFGLVGFVVTAPSDEEAAELLSYHWELNAQEQAAGGDVAARIHRDLDQKSQMWRTLKDRPHIGPNGGTASGLVGSYDTVAAKVVEWSRLGIETFMLAFQPFEQEMEVFAREVIPRVRELLATEPATDEGVIGE